MQMVHSTPTQTVSYECEKCEDVGGTFEQREGLRYLDAEGNLQTSMAEYFVECECVKQKRMAHIVKSSAITPGFQSKGFKNFDLEGRNAEVKTMYQMAADYYRNFTKDGASILFLGQPGAGKTHLMCAIANSLMRTSLVPVMYFPWVEGMSEASANDFERKDHVTERMKNIDVLFIDDLYKPTQGKNTMYPWQSKMLYEVVNHRYLNNKPMMVSSELDINTLFGTDEATASRLIEMAGTNIMQLSKSIENNYRLRGVLGGA